MSFKEEYDAYKASEQQKKIQEAHQLENQRALSKQSELDLAQRIDGIVKKSSSELLLDVRYQDILRTMRSAEISDMVAAISDQWGQYYETQETIKHGFFSSKKSSERVLIRTPKVELIYPNIRLEDVNKETVQERTEAVHYGIFGRVEKRLFKYETFRSVQKDLPIDRFSSESAVRESLYRGGMIRISGGSRHILTGYDGWDRPEYSEAPNVFMMIFNYSQFGNAKYYLGTALKYRDEELEKIAKGTRLQGFDDVTSLGNEILDVLVNKKIPLGQFDEILEYKLDVQMPRILERY